MLKNNRKKSISMVNLQQYEFQKLRKINSLQQFYASTGRLPSTSSKISLNTHNKVIEEILQKNYQFREIKLNVYKRRWFLLIILILNITISFMQWLQFCIISNIVEIFYETSSDIVNLTSLIYMVIYSILIIPVTFYCEKQSFRTIAIIGSSGTSLGSFLKIFSLPSRSFFFILLGQAVCAISQIYLSNLPSKLSEFWFPRNESSLISGFGLFASQLGLACNFLVTPFVVSSNNIQDIKKELQILLISMAGVCTIFSIIIIAAFKSKPRIPPSHLQALKLDNVIQGEKKSVLESIKKLLMSWNFILLSLGYGINIGIFNAFTTLLNSTVLHYFPNNQTDAAKIGLSLILMGLLGSLIFAFILETFQNYKMTAIWNLRLQTIAITLFFLALESRSKILLSIASILLGFFMTGFQLIGNEYAVELTFPECSFVSGILNISGYCFGILLTVVIKTIQISFNILTGNLCFSLLLMISIMFVSLTKPNSRRLAANLFIEQSTKESELMECAENEEQYYKPSTEEMLMMKDAKMMHSLKRQTRD